MPLTQIQATQQVERFVRERRDTDQKLVGWGLYFFLLSWVTLGIYPIIVFYQRINRADLFRNRKENYYRAVLDFTRQHAEETGTYDALHDQIDDLDAHVKERFTIEHKPINAGLSLVLSVVTFGIYGLFATYRLMRFWWEVQVTEQDFDEKLSQIWTKQGVVKYAITFQPVQELRRSFGLHLGLSVVTLGIYGIVWDYRLHTDPEKVYPEFQSIEDTVLNGARNAAG
jgi:Domain of unknown function (DUF4234)